MQKQEQVSQHKYWYRLSNFPDKLFSNHDSVTSFVTNPQRSWICTIKNPGIISDDVHAWLTQHNLVFNRCILFYRHVFGEQEMPHVDFEDISVNGDILFSTAGINVVLSGSSKIQFFDGSPTAGKYMVTPTGQPYISFEDTFLGNTVDENNYDFPGAYIIRTDVIHKVICNDKSPRLLVSFRFRSAEDKELSWDETLERFEDCLIAR